MNKYWKKNTFPVKGNPVITGTGNMPSTKRSTSSTVGNVTTINSTAIDHNDDDSTVVTESEDVSTTTVDGDTTTVTTESNSTATTTSKDGNVSVATSSSTSSVSSTAPDPVPVPVPPDPIPPVPPDPIPPPPSPDGHTFTTKNRLEVSSTSTVTISGNTTTTVYSTTTDVYTTTTEWDENGAYVGEVEALTSSSTVAHTTVVTVEISIETVVSDPETYTAENGDTVTRTLTTTTTTTTTTTVIDGGTPDVDTVVTVDESMETVITPAPICPVDASNDYFIVADNYYICPSASCYIGGISVVSVGKGLTPTVCSNSQHKSVILAGPFSNPCNAGKWIDDNMPAWYDTEQGDTKIAGEYTYEGGASYYTTAIILGYDAEIEDVRRVSAGDCDCPHWYIQAGYSVNPNVNSAQVVGFGVTFAIDGIPDKCTDRWGTCFTLHSGPYNNYCEAVAVLNTIGNSDHQLIFYSAYPPDNNYPAELDDWRCHSGDIDCEDWTP